MLVILGENILTIFVLRSLRKTRKTGGSQEGLTINFCVDIVGQSWPAVPGAESQTDGEFSIMASPPPPPLSGMMSLSLSQHPAI